VPPSNGTWPLIGLPSGYIEWSEVDDSVRVALKVE